MDVVGFVTNVWQVGVIENISLHDSAGWGRVFLVRNLHTSQLSIFGGLPAEALGCALSWSKDMSLNGSRPQAPVSEEALVPG